MTARTVSILLFAFVAIDCCSAFSQNDRLDTQLDAAKAAFKDGSLSNGPPRMVLKEADKLEELAQAKIQKNRFDEATKLYVRVLEIRQKYLGPKHLLVALTFGELAEVYGWQHKYEDVEQESNRALEILKDAVPPISADVVDDDTHRVVISLNNAGVYLINGGKLAAAEKVLSEAIRLDPTYVLPFGNRSLERKKRGDEKGAEEDRATAHNLGGSGW
jgi:tetratricopeptide (TPR) repeat protein